MSVVTLLKAIRTEDWPEVKQLCSVRLQDKSQEELDDGSFILAHILNGSRSSLEAFEHLDFTYENFTRATYTWESDRRDNLRVSLLNHDRAEIARYFYVFTHQKDLQVGNFSLLKECIRRVGNKTLSALIDHYQLSIEIWTPELINLTYEYAPGAPFLSRLTWKQKIQTYLPKWLHF